jgi:hypothetical protein
MITVDPDAGHPGSAVIIDGWWPLGGGARRLGGRSGWDGRGMPIAVGGGGCDGGGPWGGESRR